MLKKTGRILLVLLALLLTIVVLVAIFGPPWVRRTAEKSFPQIEGEIRLAGLSGPVDVYRDEMGVPHIYASTEHDLFFAQGYIHAQDRFWQMDFWRHQGAGRLSEMLGSNLLETDKFLRTLGWERVAREEYARMDAKTRSILEAYAEGVNAYLADHRGTALSLEYAFLPLLNPDYDPPPWTPVNTLTWAKAMAWELGRSKLNGEISYAKMLKDLPQEKIDFLHPSYPEDRPVIVRRPHLTGDATPDGPAVDGLLTAVFPALEAASRQLALLGEGDFDGIGSNSWVISGERTSTGLPFLANDMHLGVQMPSIWYENGLHCEPVGPNCPLEVVGFSFAGTPGVIVGHNNRLAWGFTNLGPDVADLYIEKINPQNPNQYEYQGKWVEMERITEVIQVAGDEPVEHTVRLTRHGPLITEEYGLSDFHETTGLDLPESYALALRWTALEPSCVMCALLGFNYAQNWDEFRAAAAQFAVPAQNIVYADVEGNIGYQTPGLIPRRAEGHSGWFPVPGWTGEYEWQDYIPFEELPYAFNPPEGYIVTANNAVVGPEYPYMISQTFAYGFRAARIVELIENAPGPIDAAYIQQIHGDNKDLLAAELVPLLLETPLNNEELIPYQKLLQGWDYQMDLDSAPALLYASFWKHLLALTFRDDLPEDFWPDGGGRWMEIVRQFLTDPSNLWWDDQTTSEVETRDQMFNRALEAAVQELRKSAGKDPADWAWGDQHTVTFRNAVMDNFPFIKNAFNRGPFPVAGGGSIVNANAWSADAGSYEVDWLVSERVIMDASNWDASLWINTTGQSGHAYHPNYIDMADPWRLIEYRPQYWSRDMVEANAERYLRLVP